jgi:regulatory protein
MTLSGGASFFVSERTVRENRLEPGMALAESEWQQLAARDEQERCLARGRVICARMENSRELLSRKLKQRGFSPASIRLACDELARDGFLDDGRYALLWARARIRRRGEGPLLIRAALQARGLARDSIENALRSCEAEGLFAEALGAAGEMEQARCVGDLPELKRRLGQRGFSKNSITEYLEKY